MKRFLALGMALILVFSLFGSSIAYAGTTSKLNKREKAIIQAFVKTSETGKVKYITKYIYPGVNSMDTAITGSYKLKILTPKYSKKYIKTEQAYCLYVTGVLVVTNGYTMKLTKTRLGILIRKKGSIEYAYSFKRADGKDIYADRIITVDKLTDAAKIELEKFLVDQYGEDTGKALMYPDITDKNKNSTELKCDDGKVTITAPANWGRYDLGIDNAILQIADLANEKCLCVVKESKVNFTKDMTLENYTELYKNSTVSRINNPIEGNIEQLEVNGNSTRYFVLSGEVSQVKVSYMIMCIDTLNDYYTIISWSMASNFDENKDEMLEIMKSFKVTE